MTQHTRATPAHQAAKAHATAAADETKPNASAGNEAAPETDAGDGADANIQTATEAHVVRARFWPGILRAFGGAILFALPGLMTMELWWLGFHIQPLRLVIFLALNVPLLTGISYYAGFEETFYWLDDLVDAFVTYAVGFVAATIILFLLGVLKPGMSADEIIGSISLQAVAGSIGAMLARSQFGNQQEKDEEDQKKRRARYAGKLFFMVLGALFLTYTLAPTEEMLLLSYKMSAWHAVALAVVSLLILHVFIYLEEQPKVPINPFNAGFWRIGFHFTGPAYSLSLLVSAYMLWTFGRTDGMAFKEVVFAMVVLGFPAAVGAGAARLIL